MFGPVWVNKISDRDRNISSEYYFTLDLYQKLSFQLSFGFAPPTLFWICMCTIIIGNQTLVRIINFNLIWFTFRPIQNCFSPFSFSLSSFSCPNISHWINKYQSSNFQKRSKLEKLYHCQDVGVMLSRHDLIFCNVLSFACSNITHWINFNHIFTFEKKRTTVNCDHPPRNQWKVTPGSFSVYVISRKYMS